MFNQGGLSLEQAPPISVVLRFFITGSVFGILLAIYMLFENTPNLVVLHILALGVMASFMLGAMFQMLPVLAGVVITTPTKKATVVHLSLILGLVAQILLFKDYYPTKTSLIASLLLGLGLLYGILLMLKELFKIKDHSSSSKGIVISLLSFFIVVMIGIYLLLTYGGHTNGLFFLQLKEIHYSFAIFGWVALLIVSISFQVVEMFYVTPKYPDFLTKYLTTSIFTLLVIKVILIFSSTPTTVVDWIIFVLFVVYSFITVDRLYKRRRPTSDATVWFWRLGMGLLIASMIIFVFNDGRDGTLSMIGYILFSGFALSVIFGMVYKIVPFLVWFHLMSQGHMNAPMMFDVIHPKKAKIHFFIHISMLIGWIVSFVITKISIFASITTLLSFGWLSIQLISSTKKYFSINRSKQPHLTQNFSHHI